MFPANVYRGWLAALLICVVPASAQTTAPSPPAPKPPPQRLPRVIRVDAPAVDMFPASVVWDSDRSPTAQQVRSSRRLGSDRSPTASQVRADRRSIDRSPTVEQLRDARQSSFDRYGDRDWRWDYDRDRVRTGRDLDRHGTYLPDTVLLRANTSSPSSPADTRARVIAGDESFRSSIYERNRWDDSRWRRHHDDWYWRRPYYRPYYYRPYYYYPYYRYDCFWPCSGSYFFYRDGGSGFFWSSRWPRCGPPCRGHFSGGLSIGINLD